MFLIPYLSATTCQHFITSSSESNITPSISNITASNRFIVSIMHLLCFNISQLLSSVNALSLRIKFNNTRCKFSYNTTKKTDKYVNPTYLSVFHSIDDR